MEQPKNFESGINHEVRSTDFLRMKYDSVEFQSKFDGSVVFGQITNNYILAQMTSLAKLTIQPNKFQICIKAGFQDEYSGFSARHIIARQHLNDIHEHYDKPNPCLSLIQIASDILGKLHNPNPNDIALAWAEEESAFVLAVDIKINFGVYHHVLCVFYLESDSRLIMGTLYTIPRFKFDSVKNGNERFTPIRIPILPSVDTQIQNLSLTANVMKDEAQEFVSGNSQSYVNIYQHLEVEEVEQPSQVLDKSDEEVTCYSELVLRTELTDNNELKGIVIQNLNKHEKEIINFLDIHIMRVNQIVKISHQLTSEYEQSIEKLKSYALNILRYVNNHNVDISKICQDYIIKGMEIMNRQDKHRKYFNEEINSLANIMKKSIEYLKDTQLTKQIEEKLLEATSVMQKNYQNHAHIKEKFKKIQSGLPEAYDVILKRTLLYARKFLDFATKSEININHYSCQTALLGYIIEQEKLFSSACNDYSDFNKELIEFFRKYSAQFNSKYKTPLLQ